MFQEINQKKNYQKIIEQIKFAIMTGEFKVGDRLPSETDLCEEFGVSRTSIREALKALEVIGLVESRKGGGSFIVNNLLPTMSNSLSTFFMLQGGSAKDFVQLRISLELGAALQLIQNGTEEDFASLKTYLDTYLNSKSDYDLSMNDIAFHESLIQLSGNPYYFYIYNSFDYIYRKNVDSSNEIFVSPQDVQLSFKLHTEIYNAIVSRDYLRAVQAINDHFDFSEAEFEAQREKYFKSK